MLRHVLPVAPLLQIIVNGVKRFVRSLTEPLMCSKQRLVTEKRQLL